MKGEEHGKGELIFGSDKESGSPREGGQPRGDGGGQVWGYINRRAGGRSGEKEWMWGMGENLTEREFGVVRWQDGARGSIPDDLPPPAGSFGGHEWRSGEQEGSSSRTNATCCNGGRGKGVGERCQSGGRYETRKRRAQS